jgi:hypothetical protein
MNSTKLTSPVSLEIPSDVGPSADYYSIAVADITTSQGATYSNRFNFTGGTGNYTEYEQHLGGASFWDADDLPCSSYTCARQCAQASYPDDLTSTSAYDAMRTCILKCPGVAPAASATGPVSGTASATATGTATSSGSSGASTTGSSASATSSGAASRQEIVLAGAAGVVGLAAYLL